MDRVKWEDYFMTMAYLCAMRSKDTSTHIGAVIVGPDNEVRSTGYNSLPRKVGDDVSMYPERFERPEKYFWMEHAERNAIYNAARVGIPTKGCILYCNGVPCADCARAIIQAGISEVIVDSAWDCDKSEKWKEHHERALQMLSEGGVKVRYWEGKLLDIVKMRDGEVNK